MEPAGSGHGESGSREGRAGGLVGGADKSATTSPLRPAARAGNRESETEADHTQSNTLALTSLEKRLG